MLMRRPQKALLGSAHFGAQISQVLKYPFLTGLLPVVLGENGVGLASALPIAGDGASLGPRVTFPLMQVLAALLASGQQ